MGRSFRFPSLQRDLAWVAVGGLIVAGFVGAAVGKVIDLLAHRHRAA